MPSWLASSTRMTPSLADSCISSSFRNLATVSALAKPASSRSTSRLAFTDWARATTGRPASASASPISCSSVVFPVPATPRIIITRSREPSTWRTAAFCPSLNQSREHGRSGSPSGRNRPRPWRAKSISRDSRASISFVVAIFRPATSLRISGRWPHLACHALDRDRANAAFQGFGEQLAFRHHRLAHETMLDGMIDRQSLATFRPGSRTLATVNRRQRLAFLVGQARVPFLA